MQRTVLRLRPDRRLLFSSNLLLFATRTFSSHCVPAEPYSCLHANVDSECLNGRVPYAALWSLQNRKKSQASRTQRDNDKAATRRAVWQPFNSASSAEPLAKPNVETPPRHADVPIWTVMYLNSRVLSPRWESLSASPIYNSDTCRNSLRRRVLRVHAPFNPPPIPTLCKFYAYLRSVPEAATPH